MLHWKLLLTLVLTTAAIPLASSPASADAGTPFSYSFTFPAIGDPYGADGFCSFPAQMSYTGTTISVPNTSTNNETDTVRTGTATLTNLYTGKSMTYTVGARETVISFVPSHPGDTIFEARGADLTWRNIYFASGAPAIEYTIGVLTERESHYGYLNEHDVVGKSVDVCAALS